jgi:hypothetical protein
MKVVARAADWWCHIGCEISDGRRDYTLSDNDAKYPKLEVLKQIREIVAKALKAPAPGKVLDLEQTWPNCAQICHVVWPWQLQCAREQRRGSEAGLATRGAHMAFWHDKPQARLVAQ